MKTTPIYGLLNGHVIGIVMKELVRRAIATIRRERIIFEARAKQGHSGELDDVVTSADKAAQHVYLRSLREGFPEFGIIAEEDQLRVECTHRKADIYFTVDPLDGTRAFVRRQSHGVGTMIALVCDGEVIAAFIGDINTGEIYGFRPGSPKVHRIMDLDVVEHLQIDSERALSSQNALLRDPVEDYPNFVRQLVGKSGLCKSYEIEGGSIGMQFARLWKAEIGAIFLRPGFQTPWDMAPIYGISQQLGFVFLESTPSRPPRFMMRGVNLIQKKTFRTEFGIMVVHESRLNEIRAIGIIVQ